MVQDQDKGLFASIDWVVVVLYLLLLVAGWISVCGASYDYGQVDLFSFDARSGKQLMWMGLSCVLGLVLLLLEEHLYETLANVLYVLMLGLLVVTIFIAPDVKGSRSWLVLGPVSLQPAEFAKSVTALCVARFMNSYGFQIQRWNNLLGAIALVVLPMLLIVAQHETGSALVYLSFFLMFYREGMSGTILFSGISAVLYFVIGLRYQNEMMLHDSTPIGRFAVVLMALVFMIGMVRVYCNNHKVFMYLLVGGLVPILLAVMFAEWSIPFNVTWIELGILLAALLYLCWLGIREHLSRYFFIALFGLCSIGFHFSTDYVMNQVMEPHQRTRINVLLGIEEDLAGAGYNVNQSKIAIGSGGLRGKGFLNGTQTKLKYVPEQDTDFIFCTVGEEQGFVGASAVLLLFLTLILRLFVLAERQSTRFGRIYGYSVIGIIFFHVFINVGMVLGLTPVIGIPLPFFSYGGSSLWGFTILLFIFLRIDAERFQLR